MQNEPILGDIFRYSATGSSIKKPVFMRVCGHFEARRTIRHDPNDVAPKRGVGGSNPLMDASEQRRKPLFSMVFGFSYMKRHEKALSLYEIKFYSKI